MTGTNDVYLRSHFLGCKFEPSQVHDIASRLSPAVHRPERPCCDLACSVSVLVDVRRLARNVRTLVLFEDRHHHYYYQHSAVHQCPTSNTRRGSNFIFRHAKVGLSKVHGQGQRLLLFLMDIMIMALLLKLLVSSGSGLSENWRRPSHGDE